MKRSLLLIVVSLYLLAGCKKGDQLTDSIEVKDGSTWIANSTGTGFKPLATKDTLFITLHNNEEHLIIALTQKGTGVFKPADVTGFYFTIGLDGITGTYKLDNTVNNQVAITTYDENTQQLKGTFNLTFKNTKTNDGHPGKIIFTNGKINAELKNEYMNPYIPK
jgi:hypothetical protein